jgi:hypothetical protein
MKKGMDQKTVNSNCCLKIPEGTSMLIGGKKSKFDWAKKRELLITVTHKNDLPFMPNCSAVK